MHRHGYQGRKFHRERDQREALIQGLAEALITHGSIETTLAKAKETVPYVEKLITKAKKQDLHNRRLIIASLQTKASAHKLIDDIAPKLTKRSSGHLRIERTRLRRGDNTQMARLSFVDDLTATPTAAPFKKETKPEESRKQLTTTAAGAKKSTSKPAIATRRKKTKQEAGT
jgi:large subunit ribosomal protein L17